MSKKAYQTPTLTDLGSVEEVTLFGRRSRRNRSRRVRRHNWWDCGS